MPSYCSIESCKKIKQTGKQNITFHKFPFLRPEILKEWINFVNKEKNWKPSKFSSICSKHFLKNDYSHGTTRKFLKAQAVPSCFIIQEPTQVSKASSIADSEEIENTEEQDQDICGLCGVEDQMKIELKENMDIVKKVLPNLKISSKNISKKICYNCYSKLQLYEKFVDKVTEAQEEDERITEPPSIPEKVRIKQEPIQESSSESDDETPQVTPQKFTSKKCEILEVVDVSSADLKEYDKMFQSVYLQCENLKSDIKVSVPKTLKIEEVSDMEDDQDETITEQDVEPSLLRYYGNNINLCKDHLYSKLDIENSGLWLKKEEK